MDFLTFGLLQVLISPFQLPGCKRTEFQRRTNKQSINSTKMAFKIKIFAFVASYLIGHCLYGNAKNTVILE